MPRIIVVDDEAAQCRCIATGLRVQGFDVTEAISGPNALERFAHDAYDVAIVDLMMPGMNGLELSRILKQRFPSVVVVLTSAYHLSQRQLDLAGIGHASFVGKPFSSEQMGQVISEQIRARAHAVA